MRRIESVGVCVEMVVPCVSNFKGGQAEPVAPRLLRTTDAHVTTRPPEATVRRFEFAIHVEAPTQKGRETMYRPVKLGALII